MMLRCCDWHWQNWSTSGTRKSIVSRLLDPWLLQRRLRRVRDTTGFGFERIDKDIEC